MTWTFVVRLWSFVRLWCTWDGSNILPALYQNAALPGELQVHLGMVFGACRYRLRAFCSALSLGKAGGFPGIRVASARGFEVEANIAERSGALEVPVCAYFVLARHLAAGDAREVVFVWDAMILWLWEHDYQWKADRLRYVDEIPEEVRRGCVTTQDCFCSRPGVFFLFQCLSWPHPDNLRRFC